MDLYEYQARELFREHGVPVLGGAIATTPEQAREVAADGGEAMRGAARIVLLLAKRPDFNKRGDPVPHGPVFGGIKEGEVGDGAEAEGRHLQDHGREGGTEDLRFSEARARLVVALGVQADCDAVRDAAASTGPLVRAGPGDGFDGEALHFRPVGIARHSRKPRVDDVADPRHRQGGLGNIRRENNAAQAVLFEDAMLLGGAQTSE